MIYYIADTHFGDGRVMLLAHRPFDTSEQMSCGIIRRWNCKVSEDDEVYVLGDFAISDDVALEILPKLKGKKHLLRGNHDRVLEKGLTLFCSVSEIESIDDDGRMVVLCHYPFLSYENSIYGAFHVFGHIHNNPNDIAFEIQKNLPKSLHAGADVIDFEPRTLDELLEMKG